MQERKSSKTFKHDTNLRIGVSVCFVFVGMVKNITMQKVLVLTREPCVFFLSFKYSDLGNCDPKFVPSTNKKNKKQTNSMIFTSSENPNSNHPTKHKADHNNKF